MYIFETCKLIFKSHLTHTIPILMTFFSFSFETTLFCCFLILLVFSFLHLDATICFYILVFSKYLGNINWEILPLVILGKPRLPQNFWLQLTRCETYSKTKRINKLNISAWSFAGKNCFLVRIASWVPFAMLSLILMMI